MQNCYVKKEQDERLTRKHIHTLKFTQEIVDENKTLKEKVKELEGHLAECSDVHKTAAEAQRKIAIIQEQYIRSAEELQALLKEDFGRKLLEKDSEQRQQTEEWRLEKQKLLSAVKSLKKNLAENETACGNHDSQIQILTLRAASLDQEIERLKEYNQKLEHTTAAQQRELLKVPTSPHNRNVHVQTSLPDASRDGGNHAHCLLLHDELNEKLTALKGALCDLHDDKARWFTERQRLQDDEALLREEVSKWEERAMSEIERRKDVEQNMNKLTTEIHRLKHESAKRDRTFKDYISLKRECEDLKEQLSEFRTAPKILPAIKTLKDHKQKK